MNMLDNLPTNPKYEQKNILVEDKYLSKRFSNYVVCGFSSTYK